MVHFSVSFLQLHVDTLIPFPFMCEYVVSLVSLVSVKVRTFGVFGSEIDQLETVATVVIFPLFSVP